MRPFRLEALPLAIAGALIGVGPLLPAPTAQADCPLPAPAIVWSYPADLDTDIPTNAMIWIVTSRGRQPQQVLLDGQPLAASPRDFSFVPNQPLSPNAQHMVTINPPVGPNLRIRFTTGPGPAEKIAPDRPIVHWVSPQATRTLSPRCQAVLNAMGCFDAGEDTHLVMAVEGMPLLWLIERVRAPGLPPELHPWPSECGLPEVFTRNLDGHLCGRGVRLHAVEATGMRTMSKAFCLGRYLRSGAALPPGDPPDASADDASAGDASSIADAGAEMDAEYFPLLFSSQSEPGDSVDGGVAEHHPGDGAWTPKARAGCSMSGSGNGTGGLDGFPVLAILVVGLLGRHRRR
jgi:MYXO-CTERM domain-containing protein